MKKKDNTKPDPTKIQLWIGVGCIYRKEDDRVRLLLPDGTSDWDYIDGAGWIGRSRPCWQMEERMSFRDRIKAMKEYDKRNGRETIFMGNF